MALRLGKRRLVGWVRGMRRILHRSHGVVEFYSRKCGCAGVECDTGFKSDFRCALHEYEYPRWCPCGECQELTKSTAKAHQRRDYEMVDRFRGQRVDHFHECGEPRLVYDEYEGWTYPEKEEEIAS